MKQCAGTTLLNLGRRFTLLREGWETDSRLRANGSGPFFLGLVMIDRARIDAALALIVRYHETFTDEEAERLDDAFGAEGFTIERVLYTECDNEHTAPAADEVYESDARTRLLRAALEHLTDRQIEVIELRYGLSNGREYTQEQIASMLDISQATVWEHEQAALKKLRGLIPV